MMWPFSRKKPAPKIPTIDVLTAVHDRMNGLEQKIDEKHLNYLSHLDGMHAELHATTKAMGRLHDKLDKALGKRNKKGK